MSGFGSCFQLVIRLIDKAMRKMDTTTRGLITNEIHKHMDMAREEANNFMGREKELKTVELKNKSEPMLKNCGILCASEFSEDFAV